MGKMVAAEYVTIDGVMEDPGGVGEFEYAGWTNPYWSDDLGKLQTDLLFASDALLLGRVTYQAFAAAWPDMEHEAGEFAHKMNTMPKFVASRTLKDMEWNATLITGDVADEVAKLKRQPDQKLLIYGSAMLVQTLAQRQLIDQYRLMVYPVVLGVGKPLFKDTGKRELRLVDRTTTSTGVLVLDYEPAPAANKD